MSLLGENLGPKPSHIYVVSSNLDLGRRKSTRWRSCVLYVVSFKFFLLAKVKLQPKRHRPSIAFAGLDQETPIRAPLLRVPLDTLRVPFDEILETLLSPACKNCKYLRTKIDPLEL